MRQLKPDCGVARPSLGWPNGFGRHGVTPSSLKQQEEEELDWEEEKRERRPTKRGRRSFFLLSFCRSRLYLGRKQKEGKGISFEGRIVESSTETGGIELA